jgi:hypothetical protein
MPAQRGLIYSVLIGLAGAALCAGAVVLMRPQAPTTPKAQVNVADVVRATLAASPCSWIDYTPLSRADDGRLSLSLTGAAGDPAAVAGAARSAIEGAGERVDLNPRGVLALAPAACPQMDAFRAVQAPATPSDQWVVPQAALFHPQAHGECRNDPTQAMAVIQGQLGKGGGDDVALVVMGPNGERRSVFNGVTGLNSLISRTSSGALPGAASKIGRDRFSVSLCHRAAGTYGVLLVRGAGPFDLGLSQAGASGSAPQPGDFATRFQRAARLNGWRTQMGWYEIDAAPIPSSFTAPPSDAFPSAPPAAPPAPPVARPPVVRPTVRPTVRPARPAARPAAVKPRPPQPKPPPPPPKPKFKPVPLDRS